jgi:hypothetical protein
MPPARAACAADWPPPPPPQVGAVAPAIDGGASAKARRKRKRDAAAAGAAGIGAAQAAAWANAKVQKRAFSEAWMAFLQMELPGDIYKKVGVGRCAAPLPGLAEEAERRAAARLLGCCCRRRGRTWAAAGPRGVREASDSRKVLLGGARRGPAVLLEIFLSVLEADIVKVGVRVCYAAWRSAPLHQPRRQEHATTIPPALPCPTQLLIGTEVAGPASRPPASCPSLLPPARPHPPCTPLQVLIKVHSAVIPNVTDPLLMADFLTHSIGQGGLLGILALNGLFLLVTRHGLEYPRFYQRLYSLLQVGAVAAGLQSAAPGLVRA